MADTVLPTRSAGVSPMPGFLALARWLRERNEWKVAGALWKADPALAGAWWVVLIVRGLLPAAFGIAMGVLVGAV